ncbi:MAG: histidine phosphatase family protein [Verrucomicrobia bacterium]|nr:histidine phosphatase family protein [Verrucomicrobiota bacterium]
MDTPTRLYLIRHGEVEERYHRVFGGRIDMELSPLGHEQARTTAEYLRAVRFDAIFASPMKRAQQTAAPLLAQYPFAPTVLEDLREVDFGAWTGLTWQQVHEQFQTSAHDWLHELEKAAIPGAESAAQYRARIEPCVRRILHEGAGRHIAVVCHGGVIRMMLAILLELPLPKMAAFDVEYGSVTVVHHQPRRVAVQLHNFTPWRDGA